MIEIFTLYFFISTASLSAILMQITKPKLTKSLKGLTGAFFLLPFFYFLVNRNIPKLGNDLSQYLRYYDNIMDTNYLIVYFLKDFDIGFYGLMYLSKTIGITPNGFFYLILALCIFLFVCALNNLFVKPYEFISSILLFLSSASFFLVLSNVIRQGLSFAILIYILSSTKKNSLLRIFMVFTHKGAVLFFLKDIFSAINYSKRVFLIIISLIVSIVIPKLLLIFSKSFDLKMIEFYLNDFERASSENSIIKVSILILTNIFFINFEKHFKKSHIQKRLYDTYFIFTLFTLLFFSIDGIFSRLNIYCSLLSLPVFIFINSYIKKSYRSYYFIGLILFNLIYSMYVLNHPSIWYNLGLS